MPFQYAAKLICGVSKEGVGLTNGTYETLINIHNPGRTQEFKYKLAVAGEGKSGKIFPFKGTGIETDGAVFFACRTIRKIYGVSDTLIDGFFVIESSTALDVIAVYTTMDLSGKGVPAIAVERVFERAIRAFTPSA
jgi:hypothetical protein